MERLNNKFLYDLGLNVNRTQINKFVQLLNENTKVFANKPIFDDTSTIITNKGLWVGKQCELPYLQSDHAIATLYTTSQTKNDNNGPIFNPSRSISHARLAQLRSIHIYYCSISSLRQLGTGWMQLKTLTVSRTQLADLSGVSAFSNLEELFVPFNLIESLSELMFHPALNAVDLQGNKITKIEETEYLLTINNLKFVNLNQNPLIKQPQNVIKLQNSFGYKLDPIISEQPQQKQIDSILQFQLIQYSHSLILSIQKQFQNDFLYWDCQLNMQIQQKNEIFDWIDDQHYLLTPLAQLVSISITQQPTFLVYLQNKLISVNHNTPSQISFNPRKHKPMIRKSEKKGFSISRNDNPSIQSITIQKLQSNKKNTLKSLNSIKTTEIDSLKQLQSTASTIRTNPRNTLQKIATTIPSLKTVPLQPLLFKTKQQSIQLQKQLTEIFPKKSLKPIKTFFKADESYNHQIY